MYTRICVRTYVYCRHVLYVYLCRGTAGMMYYTCYVYGMYTGCAQMCLSCVPSSTCFQSVKKNLKTRVYIYIYHYHLLEDNNFHIFQFSIFNTVRIFIYLFLFFNLFLRRPLRVYICTVLDLRVYLDPRSKGIYTCIFLIFTRLLARPILPSSCSSFSLDSHAFLQHAHL